MKVSKETMINIQLTTAEARALRMDLSYLISMEGAGTDKVEPIEDDTAELYDMLDLAMEESE